ncbi:mandelate racemase/muconate lactonizing enzyme family protein [Brevibacterium marinum]|uniref:L-alanine-DL-glutamate epimerase-like enolase superfamily enzyme n=1 Tax=Brevibacterium marinum TaxID=418643 RepID=A0A846RWI6_9MICO|nr:mandelate racemase/muconate lactonizing enzyme family protein [Brevibacterium marinum]NJC54983.1 L-alanine-DL-glutamate epimerase-like enolase superfamily enzyme [Brevibacterium marinum]
MKITSIDLFEVPLPYSGGTYLLSGGREYTEFGASIVRITTDKGVQGWGESTPFGSTYVAAHALGTAAGIAELAPVLLGRDPRQVDRIADLMDANLTGHNHAKAPLDVACWDLFGKSVNLPVCELLGGSTGSPMPIMSSIHIGPPEEMRSRVGAHRELGYRGHSIKIGSTDGRIDPGLDAERIRACLADRRPGEFFLVDANTGLSSEEALRMFNLLPPGLDFVLESPCASWGETESLRRRSPYPIILDELAVDAADLVRAVAHDVADGISLKVTPAGGLTPGRRQRDIAVAAGMTLSVQDTVGSDIAYAAITHLGATVPSKLLRCILKASDMVTLTTADFRPLQLSEGVLPPDRPGLGVDVDETVLGTPTASWSI